MTAAITKNQRESIGEQQQDIPNFYDLQQIQTNARETNGSNLTQMQQMQSYDNGASRQSPKVSINQDSATAPPTQGMFSGFLQYNEKPAP